MARAPPRKRIRTPTRRSPADNPLHLWEMWYHYEDLIRRHSKWTVYKKLAKKFGFKSANSIRYYFEPSDRVFLYLNFSALVEKAFTGVARPLTVGELSDRLVTALRDAGRPNIHHIQPRTIEKYLYAFEERTGEKLLEKVYSTPLSYKLFPR